METRNHHRRRTTLTGRETDPEHRGTCPKCWGLGMRARCSICGAVEPKPDARRPPKIKPIPGYRLW